MVSIPWCVAACVTCLAIGLAFPRLCPRCRLEQIWVDKTIRELKKVHGDKPTKTP